MTAHGPWHATTQVFSVNSIAYNRSPHAEFWEPLVDYQAWFPWDDDVEVVSVTTADLDADNKEQFHE